MKSRNLREVTTQLADGGLSDLYHRFELVRCAAGGSHTLLKANLVRLLPTLSSMITYRVEICRNGVFITQKLAANVASGDTCPTHYFKGIAPLDFVARMR